jgi:uncharacterized membrane protein
MKNWSKRKKILIGLLVLFLAAQAIQPSKNQGSQTGPKDITTVMQVPDSVMSVLKKSCYDCHSNYTTYPWYDNITPANWFVANHVNEGKRELNFTTFGEYSARRQAKKLDESAKQIEKGEMPISSYTLLHPDAKLSDAQRQLLINWFKNAKAGTGINTEAGPEPTKEKDAD